jgi:hypothetical protein
MIGRIFGSSRASSVGTSGVEVLTRKEPKTRWDPRISPQDEEWKRKELAFARLLREPSQCVEAVLENYFTDEEAKIFVKAKSPPSLVSMQRNNRDRYYGLLAGKLNGCKPSLAMKLTMLWFGLPVEPVITTGSRLESEDSDEEDNDGIASSIEAQQPPLHFLTAHDRRNWGYDSLRGNYVLYLCIRRNSS